MGRNLLDMDIIRYTGNGTNHGFPYNKFPYKGKEILISQQLLKNFVPNVNFLWILSGMH